MLDTVELATLRATCLLLRARHSARNDLPLPPSLITRGHCSPLSRKRIKTDSRRIQAHRLPSVIMDLVFNFYGVTRYGTSGGCTPEVFTMVHLAMAK